MLILIPIFAFISVSITLITIKPKWSWRLAVLRGSVLLSAYMVLSNEVLGLFHAITTPWLALIWTIPIVLGSVILHRRVPELKRTLRGFVKIPASWPNWVLLIAILIVFSMTAFVAWLAPPNTWDSLNTHMSRVAQWAQNHSLNPFATGIEKQLYYPPFPGIAVLQSYLLTSGDHWANFSQWMAMILSAIGVSYLASLFGVHSSGQWFVATFAITLPVGIIQSTSSMTDYLVALWLIVIAIESIYLAMKESTWEGIVILSLAAGLAVNTKPIAFAYLLPFAIYTAIHLLRLIRFPQFILAGAVSILLILMINAGYLSRNIAIYNNPLGPRTGISVHSNEIVDLRMVVSNTFRNASLQAWSPIRIANSATYAALAKLHTILDLDLSDPRTSVHSTFSVRTPSTDEKKAGNYFHALLILGSMTLLLVKKKRNKIILFYSITVIWTFILLSTIFKFSIFGSRYQLPFFILFAPIVGSVLDEIVSSKWKAIIGLFLLISSWPWLVGIDQRPIWPKQDGNISLLESKRRDLYFPVVPFYRERYQEMARQIVEKQCLSVAIMLKGSAAEYPLWVYLGSPNGDLKIEWLIAGTPSEAYIDPDFQPCAVICDTSCADDMQYVRGLPLYDSKSGYRTFMR